MQKNLKIIALREKSNTLDAKLPYVRKFRKGKHCADRKGVSGFCSQSTREEDCKGDREHSRKVDTLYDDDTKITPVRTQIEHLKSVALV